MIKIVDFIVENYERFGLIVLFLILLGMTGNITKLIRDAKEGLKQVFTPLGFVIMGGLIYLIIQVVKSI